MNKKLLLVFLIASLSNSMNAVAVEPGALQPIGTMGKGQRVLGDGNETVLYEHQGTGCLSHFWFGGAFKGAENTRIRYYVDGEETPSIDMQLYMGHGIGFGDNHAPWATKYIGKIGNQNGIYNNYRIPFGKSIRVTAQRDKDADKIPISGGSSAASRTDASASAVWNCRRMRGSS
jgi:hypothetical protein